jgi:cysteine-rich repeat protein
MRFQPNTGFCGNTSFTYTVYDQQSNLSNVATVSIYIPCPVVIQTCGNRTYNIGEDCDDGNTIPGDGCENNCTTSS